MGSHSFGDSMLNAPITMKRNSEAVANAPTLGANISMIPRSGHSLWDFASTASYPGGDWTNIGALVLPLVQSLFVGIMRDASATCFVWDCMFLLGADALPQMCAAYLMALRTTFVTALSPASATSMLERTLNVTCGSVTTEDMRRIVDAYVVPHMRRDHAEGMAPAPGLGVGKYMMHEGGKPRDDPDVKVYDS